MGKVDYMSYLMNKQKSVLARVRKKVLFEGKVYESIAAVASHIGIGVSAVSARIRKYGKLADGREISFFFEAKSEESKKVDELYEKFKEATSEN
jgi:hypothetical protein